MPLSRITDKRLVQKVDNESIVYDQDNHKVYHLNEPAAKAWQLCEQCNSIEELAEKLSAETGLPADEEVAHLAILELREAGLIDGEYDSSVGANYTRRELLESMAHLAITLPVVVAMFAPTAAMAQSPADDPDPTTTPQPTPSSEPTPAPPTTTPAPPPVP